MALPRSSFALQAMWLVGVAGILAPRVLHAQVITLSEAVRTAESHERSIYIEAGIRRMRPVLITVGATVLALFPLALHGGPLWEALCYVQIGGLTLATAVTLFLVPVFYAVFVLDLKVVTWKSVTSSTPA